MDNTELIEEARKYRNWPHYFPSSRELWLSKVRTAIAEMAGSSEQKQELIALKKELSVPPRSVVSFPGSCTVF